MKEWPKCCRSCRSFEDCFSPAIDGKGNKDARVLCLFDAPTKDDDEIGQILAGPSGKRMDDIACNLFIQKGLDVSPDAARWENVVMCHPSVEKTPKIDTIRYCRGFWITKANEMPNLEKIICFGTVALTSVLDQAPGKLDRWRRRAIKVPEFPHWDVFATYAPGYTLGHKNPQAEKWVLEDLEFALNWNAEAPRRDDLLDAGTSVAEKDDRLLWAIPGPKDNKKEWWILNPHRLYLSWDLEHTGTKNKSPWPDAEGNVGELMLACWSTRFSQGRSRLDHGVPAATFRSLFDSPSTTHIVFKATHDIPWLNVNYGILPKGPLYDPMIAYQLLDENYPDKSLEGICKRVFNAEPWKKVFWDNFSWDDPDWNKLIAYCEEDVIWTTRLAFWSAQQLVEQGLEKLFVHEMVNRMTTIEGICLGVPYDVDCAEGLRDQLLLESEAYHARAAEMAGKEINLNAPAQVLSVLKVLNRRVRDTSTPTLRRWLWRHPDTPFVRMLLEYRRLQSKLRYLTHYRKTLRQDTRFHADMEPMTETGRYRCSGPNLMNVMR